MANWMDTCSYRLGNGHGRISEISNTIILQKLQILLSMPLLFLPDAMRLDAGGFWALTCFHNRPECTEAGDCWSGQGHGTAAVTGHIGTTAADPSPHQPQVTRHNPVIAVINGILHTPFIVLSTDNLISVDNILLYIPILFSSFFLSTFWKSPYFNKSCPKY